ncbi:MAG: hypothetical protein K2N34_05145 [Lachnospiraceae bacterium]|nr:hypothetical protein [Lachnospiraceae bacterium]
MKTKKILTAIFLTGLTAAMTVSVSAGTLTKETNSGETEVTARILGTDEPGDVSYIITIPDKIDFGTLVQPENENDSFKDVNFAVTATKITGFENHSNWYVRVKVRDRNFVLDEEERFFLSQKTASYPDSSSGNNKFEYSVFLGEDNIVGNRKDENGFNIAFFDATGQEATGTLRLNQNQLYGLELENIAGEYSGCMVFHSSIVSTTSTN